MMRRSMKLFYLSELPPTRENEGQSSMSTPAHFRHTPQTHVQTAIAAVFSVLACALF